jgi:hypothetical protein
MLVYLVDEAKASTAVEQALGGITVISVGTSEAIVFPPDRSFFRSYTSFNGNGLCKGLCARWRVGLTVTTQKLGN